MRRFIKLFLGLTLLLFCGCSGYGEVSPTAYEYAKALYAISNRQANQKLDPVAKQIEQAESAGEITGREATWLHDIVEDCRQNEWQAASKAARRMMEDQVAR